MNDNTNRELESYSSFDNRIKKIKEYIDDIRVDLDDLKHNEYNNNPEGQKHEMVGEQYNSDAYSFQEEANKYQNEENLANPKDQILNSINTQELIQNMNNSLNRNYNNEENTTNSNLLLSNSSYNLNFNYNNNYEKKDKFEQKEMNIVDSPYIYKLDSTKKSLEENCQVGNFYEYNQNNLKNREELSKNYENYQNEKINNQEENTNELLRSPHENLNSDIYRSASPYSENNYNEKSDYETKRINPLTKQNFYTHEHEISDPNAKGIVYNFNNINNSALPDNNHSKKLDQPLSSYPQSQVHSYRERDLKDNYHIEPQYVNNNNENKNLQRNNSQGIIKENLPYTNNTLNYNYKGGQNIHKPNINNNSLHNKTNNLYNSNEYKTKNLDKPKQQPLAVYERFNSNQEYNYDKRSQEHLPLEHDSQQFNHKYHNNSHNINNSGHENDKLKLNYNYPIHNSFKNNQLIQSLEEIERSIERERSYSPNYSQRKMNYHNYAILENRSSELEKQIADLHIMINELQKSNTMLQMEIVQLNQKNLNKSPNQVYYEKTYSNLDSEDLYNFKRNLNNNSNANVNNLQNTDKIIINEIQKIFGGIKKEEIINRLNEQSKLLTKANKMEDFINKIQGLYNSLYDIKGNNKVRVKVLWRWIKNVIKHVGNDKTYNINQQLNKEICDTLIDHYKLKDVNDLKLFINELINNSKNKEPPQRHNQNKSVTSKK